MKGSQMLPVPRLLSSGNGNNRRGDCRFVQVKSIAMRQGTILARLLTPHGPFFPPIDFILRFDAN